MDTVVKSVHDVVIIKFAFNQVPSGSKSDYIICSLPDFFKAIQKPSDEETEYSTDSDYEEETGIKRPYVPPDDPDKEFRRNIVNEFIIDLTEEIKQNVFKKIVLRMSKSLGWCYFYEYNKVVYCFVTYNDKMFIKGVFKDIKQKYMSYYFRRELLNTVQTNAHKFGLFMGESAYDSVFSSSNVLIEHSDMIWDKEMETDNINVYDIKSIRDDWINSLKKINTKKTHYDYLLI